MNSGTSPDTEPSATMLWLAGPRGPLTWLTALVAVCASFEWARRALPQPRPDWFVVAVVLHRAAILALLAVLWHRLLLWFWEAKDWLDLLLAGLVIFAIATILAFPRAEDALLLPAYAGLALYDGFFSFLLASVGGLIFVAHLACGPFWLLLIEPVHRKLLRRYLATSPGGIGVHRLRGIHREVFGWVPEDEDYEEAVRKAILGTTDPVRRWHLQQNLAMCLVVPIAHGSRSTERLVEAAEYFYKLAIEATDPTARTRFDAAERCVWNTLLLQSAQALPPFEAESSCGWLRRVIGAAILRGHRLGYLLWRELPLWCRAIISPDSVGTSHGEYVEVTAKQSSLVSFCANPGAADALERAGMSANLSESVSRRLFLLGLAKWMGRIEIEGGEFFHEDLIEEHTALRQSAGLREFWRTNAVFEWQPPQDWVGQRCARLLAAAWERYGRKLDLVKGAHQQFAEGLARSNHAIMP